MATTGAVDLLVTKQALQELKQVSEYAIKAQQDMIALSEATLKATSGKNNSSIKVPTQLAGGLEANAKINEQLLKQSQLVADLTVKNQKLAEAKIKVVAKTREEIIETRLKNQQTDREILSSNALAGAYKNLSNQQAIAKQRVQDLIANGKTAAQTQSQYNKELERAQADFDKLDKKVVLAKRSVREFNDNVGNYPMRVVGGIRDLMGAFGIVGGITGAVALGREIFQTTKEIQSMDLALKTVTGTSEAMSQSMGFLNEISQKYGGNIQVLTKSFIQFYASAKDKISAKEIQSIFESVTKSAGFLGLSTEKQEKAFLALNQMMSKGTIQAEELRGQLSEALPNAMGIMTKAVQVLHPEMKVTEQTIAKMMKDGKLMSAEVLPEFARQMEIAYGVDKKNRVDTLAASTERLNNSWINLVRSLESSKGTLSSFFSFFGNLGTKIINGLSNDLDRLREWNKTAVEKRQDQLDIIKKDAYKLAQESLEKTKDSDEKEAKVNSLIVKLEKRKLEITKEINKLVAENQKLTNESKNKENVTVREYIDKLNEVTAKVKKNRIEITELNTEAARTTGLIDGLKARPDKTNAINSDKKTHDFDPKYADFLASDFALKQKQLQQDIDFEKTRYNNEKLSFEDRRNAKILYQTWELDFIKNEQTEKERLLKQKLASDKESIEKSYKDSVQNQQNLARKNKALNAIDKQFSYDNELIKLEYNEKSQKIFDDYLNIIDKQIAELKAKSTEKLNVANEEIVALENYSKALREIAKNGSVQDLKVGADGKNNFERTQQSQADAKLKADKLKLQSDLELKQVEISLASVRSENSQEYINLKIEEAEIVKKLGAIESEEAKKSAQRIEEKTKALSDLYKSFTSSFLSGAGLSAFDGITEKLKKLEDDATGTALVMSEAFQQAFNFINNASQENFDAEYSRLETQKDTAIQFAGESTTAKAEIEKQYEERKREIKQREANQKKESAIFNAIIDTAQAILSFLAQGDIAGSVIAGIIGGIQIATIQSQPIPQFATGGTHTGGLMVVNDAKGSNYKETIVTPDGRISQPQGRNVLMNAPAGTEIFTPQQWADFQMKQIMKEQGVIMPKYTKNTTAISTGMSDEQVERIVSAVQNKSEISMQFDEKGINVFKQNGNTRTKIMNSRFNLTGQNV